MIGLIGLLMVSCKTYTPNNLPDHHLHFGKGGGFTGMTTEYMLLRNGQLFVREGRAGSGEWREMEKVEKAAAKDLYRTWENDDLFKVDVREPGNLYYFMTMKKDTAEFRQSWGASGYQPDESLKSFYGRAMDLIRTAESKPDTRN
ncbi:hypothetical protein CRP01_21905 [Flavilitoribacter nigricans DSM 23189 = NBRC 102662]|uniref:Uncharacterized protein n=1 Tax=Flavilitoribacter nigricans (strain ATCC 23147 / DSM 23189 / NBRC 102662 / NCIMB 1420 / SS-2) TaxID=1122177 RepID=A0A2D0N739_FLAN2|nr:hypothetical protein CRP01_21905 [Flavilitoribacter nigricans DSM 23189 = NBRC 102662]